MDITLFRYLNGFAGHGGLIDSVIIFCASYLQHVLALVLAVAVLWPRRRFRMGVGAILAAAVSYGVVKKLILLAWQRPRPFVVLHDAVQLISAKGEEYQSFPSGHALFFFALAMAVYLYNKKLGWAFFAGAVLMGIARVAAGVHWPSDILGGAIIGIITAQLLIRLVPALRPRIE